tara:strand:- start:19390 stop:19617 length:228 start_codon:yes stop_codon:yes gene_type:complete
MAHDEFNSGARHGFCMAKLAVRDIDRTLEYPNEEDHTQKSWCLAYEKYHAEKDLLHKIYEAINKSMEEEVSENDY